MKNSHVSSNKASTMAKMAAWLAGSVPFLSARPLSGRGMLEGLFTVTPGRSGYYGRNPGQPSGVRKAKRAAAKRRSVQAHRKMCKG